MKNKEIKRKLIKVGFYYKGQYVICREEGVERFIETLDKEYIDYLKCDKIVRSEFCHQSLQANMNIPINELDYKMKLYWARDVYFLTKSGDMFEDQHNGVEYFYDDNTSSNGILRM